MYDYLSCLLIVSGYLPVPIDMQPLHSYTPVFDLDGTQQLSARNHPGGTHADINLPLEGMK
jgi:hypothetical protein